MDLGDLISGVGQVALGVDQYGAQVGAIADQYTRTKTKLTAEEISARQTSDYLQLRAYLASTQAAGAQKVAYAASGVDATRGTAAHVQANTMAQGEFTAQMVQNNLAREIWGLEKSRQWAEEDMGRQVGNANREEIGAILGGLSKFAGGGGGGGGFGGGGGGDNSGDGSGAFSGSSAVESAFEGG